MPGIIKIGSCDRISHEKTSVDLSTKNFLTISPTSCHFIPFLSKYSHQHPVLKHSQHVLSLTLYVENRTQDHFSELSRSLQDDEATPKIFYSQCTILNDRTTPTKHLVHMSHNITTISMLLTRIEPRSCG
jgi:hypothetical protein